MSTTAYKQLATRDADWWRGAVIYQIYPRSYQDDNGDGIGDLAGICRRLPYISSLGVDAIWISPFFVSPMLDYGYDVSDYRDVDPMFGTLADFDRLIETAHALGIRIMIDLVLSHTSNQHPWFKESASSIGNDKDDWYVWSDALPDGSPPNNWLSIFGGSAWQWHTRRRQYYLHNFLSEQPDLNLHNPQVQDELLGVARFWLERGVDGFRLDTINFYFHDQALRSNPALPVELRNSTIAPSVNPYNYQQHLYDKNRPENLDFLRRFRAVMDEFPCIAAVGEVGDDQIGMEIMGEYTRGDDLMHMCYAFDFLSPNNPTAQHTVDVLSKFAEVASDGWGCWAFSNHDVVRHASRWNLSAESQRCYTLLIMCLKGSVCLYQGEELGLEEAELSYEQLQDPYGIAFWPDFKGRDGCRTPMPWSLTAGNDDFSSAADTWLPIPESHRALAVDQQENDANSLLAFYRQCLKMRKAYPVLAKGELEDLQANGQLLSFTRSSEGSRLHCIFNLGDSPVDITLPGAQWQRISGVEALADPEKTSTLAPWQVLVAEEQ